MRPAWKWTLGSVAAGMAVIIGAGYYFLVHDVNWLRDPAGRYASTQAGRETRLAGDLEIHWSLRPRIVIRDFHLANATWSKDAEMAAAERVEVVVDVPQLLRGRLVLPEVVLVRPRLLLERRQDGEANWTLGAKAATDVVAPDDRAEFPLIGLLSVEEGKIVYRDARAGLDLDGDIATIAGTGGQGRQDVSLAARGRLQGEPFKLRLTGGSLLQLRADDEPYPLKLEIDATSTTARFAGTLDDPVRFEGVKLDVALNGDNLGRLARMTGVPLPETPPYDLRGHLLRDGSVWTIQGLEGLVGKSDLGGLFRIDTGRPRLYLEADLKSRSLDYRDVGPLIGVPVRFQGAEVKAVPRPKLQGEDFVRVLPDAKLNIRQVREVDAKVKYRADKVLAPNAPLENVDLDLDLKDGVLRFRPLKVRMAGGDVTAAVDVDARQKEVRTAYDIRLSRFRLERFLDEAGLKDRGSGRIDGRIRLVGTGDTIARSLATSEGDIRMVMGGGQMSNLGIELAGLDLFEALGFALGGDGKATIRCAVVDFGVRQGVMRPRVFVIDTSDSTLTGDGSVDLGTEALDLGLLAHPKDPSLFSVRTPLTVRGHFGAPSVGVRAGPIAARAVGAVALGVVLTPLASILAFIEPGLARDSDCAKLMAEPPKAN